VIRVALDAMGGDHAPRVEIEGLRLALRDLPATFRVQLVGKPDLFVERKPGHRGADGNVGDHRLIGLRGAIGRHVLDRDGQGIAEQQTLVDIMSAVVGVSRIGIHDNFFEFGGDSILAIQVVARAQEAGLKLTAYDLFVHPTVADLAAVAASGVAIDAEQGEIAGPLVLSPAQRRFCRARYAEPHRWTTSVLVELGARVDADVVARGVDRVLGHHDGLRRTAPAVTIGMGSTVVTFIVAQFMSVDAARWINHACTPNCEADETDDCRVFIKALRDIEPGEELNYDYGLIVDGRHTRKLKEEYACRCGTSGCRGTMLAKRR